LHEGRGGIALSCGPSQGHPRPGYEPEGCACGPCLVVPGTAGPGARLF
jgi:hypothetical protein